MNDTDAKIQRILIEGYRKMTPQQKFKIYIDAIIQTFLDNEYLMRLYLSIMLQPGVVEGLLEEYMKNVSKSTAEYGRYFMQTLNDLGVKDPIFEAKIIKIFINV